MQNWIVQKVARVLSKKLHTKVKVDHVSFSLFNRMNIEGVLVEDLNKDTLLYSGSARVKITDWFFLKDKATLKYVGLKNTQVNIKRTDSVWNYQFLVDYFSTPKKSTPKKEGLQIDLKILEIENLVLNKTDKWLGQNMQVSLKKADLSAEEINFSTKKIAVNFLTLDAPVFSQTSYTPNKPDTKDNRPPPAPAVPATDTAIPYQWNKGEWAADIKTLQIKNGIFHNERKSDRAKYTDRFDGQHLYFSKINGDFKNIQWQKDTIKATIALAADELSGLHAKKLSADFTMHPNLMEFNHLNLEINNSRLGNYFAMEYDDMGKDMADFIHSVTLRGNFVNSKINSEDLAIFAPALKSWNTTFQIQGNAKGTIDNISTQNMVVKNATTYIDGNLSLKGLPDINNTFIDFNTNNLQTQYSDLITFIPALKSIVKPRIDKLGTIYYTGSFTGFTKDFVTYGNFRTNLGSLTADLNMKLPKNQSAAYSGSIATQAFNLGEFIGNKSMGTIAGEGKVKGSSFKIKSLNANFVGKIKSLELGQYTYQNISVDGDFKNQTFSGHLDINDPNLQLENLEGTVGLNNENTQFNFDAVLKTIHLKALHFTKEDFSLAGHFNLDFTGNTIDNFLGVARVYDATLYNQDDRLSFDSLTIKSLFVDNKKHLTLQSNEIEAAVVGNFKILDLPDAFKVFLSKYYPAYIKTPNNYVSNQDLVFSINTKNIDQYVHLANEKLSGFNNAVLSGSLSLAKNELIINASVPEFSYDKKIFSDVRLESRGNIDTLYATISLGDVGITDSLHFPTSNLTIMSTNNVSMLALKTTGTTTINEAALNASITTLPDGVTIHFFPSTFIINEQTWQLEKDGELSIRKKFLDANEIKFVQGSESLIITTELDDESDNTNVVVRLNKINIGDFLPFVTKQPNLDGLLTGTFTLKDPFGKQQFNFEGSADNFLFEKKPLGKVDFNAHLNTNNKILVFSAFTNNEFAIFTANGKYNLNDSINNPIDISLLVEKIELNTLEPYLNTIFGDVHGQAEANLKFSGNKNHILLSGSATLKEASLKVLYTQCTYRVKNETIIFNPDEIDLGYIALIDKYGNKGIASGRLYHKFFKEFEFDNIVVNTNKLLLLNTTKKDNSQFYGRVVGKATMSINGPITNMSMNIDGKPSDRESDSSHIYLPNSSSKEIGAVDYIEFIQFGSEMESQLQNKQGTNIVVNINIEANPACKVDVILDELTGDIIKAAGSGNLKIKVGTKEPLSIRGKYIIEKGEYTFNFQQFVEKGFTLKKGGYISWEKPDPFDATISIDAEYTAKDVDFSSFPSLKGYRAKSDVDVVAHLTNTLKSPEISFEFILPSSSPYAQDNFIQSKLDDFTRDKNEMNKQISSVLIFNSFVPPNQGFLQNQNALSIGINTIGQILSRSLTEYVNRYLQKIGLTFNFDVSSSNDVNNAINQNLSQLQAAANFAFSKQWFNDRLVVTVGGNVDVNNPYALSNKNSNSSLLLTPDFSAEWLLTKDGKLRVIGFRRSNIDFSYGQRNRQGVSLSYRNDFDKFSDLFKRKKSTPLRKYNTNTDSLPPLPDSLFKYNP